jgi:RNA polymerase sigma-70 factor (ECF subfamily)
MVSMGESDQAAIKAVLAGERDAYRQLVMRHSRTLFRLAYRMTGNEADADDVVQEAFLRGYLKLATFASRADFGTWIYRIAVHCALDKLSQRKPETAGRIAEEPEAEPSELVVPDPAPGPERMALSAELGTLQEMAMRGLTAVERSAFVLRHMEDRTTDEIAEALQIAPNAAKQTVFRAVQKVRRRLETLKVSV